MSTENSTTVEGLDGVAIGGVLSREQWQSIDRAEPPGLYSLAELCAIELDGSLRLLDRPFVFEHSEPRIQTLRIEERLALAMPPRFALPTIAAD